MSSPCTGATSIPMIHDAHLQARTFAIVLLAALAVACRAADSLTTSHPPPHRVCNPPGIPITYYVDAVAGSDTNRGTASLPFQSIQQAANVVNPGDTVVVRDGIYTGDNATILDIERCGTAGHVIVFMAEHKWGAVLDGQNNTTVTGVKLGASFVRVAGFEIRGVSRYGFDMSEGEISDVDIAQNHIHDVGRYCTDASGGINAISVVDDNVLIEQNLIHDIGRYSSGENGCVPSTQYWQNHDHGVYVSSGNNIVIRNNVFYSIGHGWAIHRYSGSNAVVDSLLILNNTFAFPNPNKAGQIIISSPTVDLVMVNNIFYQPLTTGIVYDATVNRVTMANNLATGSLSNGASMGIVGTANQENVDPQFVNPIGFDFHLQTGSPAIQAGQSLVNVPDDFAGVTRPTTGAYDIGAYQFK